MNAKKSKSLRRLARTMVTQMKLDPKETDSQYKKMKSTYKAAKGQI